MFSIRPQRLKNIIRRFPKAKILVMGDVMLDEYIWGKVTRISPEAPVPIVKTQSETSMPGGAANVARNISVLDANSSLLGIIGKDIKGGQLLKLLKEEKINTKGLVKIKGLDTIIKTRIIAHSQQVVRIDKERNTASNGSYINKLISYAKKVVPDIDGIIIEDYGKGLIVQDVVNSLSEICRQHKKPLMVDPKKGNLLDYSGITILTPNLEEALAIVGQEYLGEYVSEKVEEAGRLIMDKWDLRGLLITLGEHGMILFERDKPSFKIPTVAKEVFDVSGAGDTVAGVFMVALASGASMKEAAVLSNIAAGIVVGKVGTATVSRRELGEALKRNE